MQGEWADEEIARKWDSDPARSNPLRGETLDILLTLLKAEYQPGKVILDVGFGSGLVEELIFREMPDTYVVGIDASLPMIEIARRRLAPYEGRYGIVIHDVTDLATLTMPAGEYQIAISVQTLCNVPDEDKKAVCKFVHGTLDEGGLFIILDRIGINTPALFNCYRTIWHRLNRIHEAHINEGKTIEEHMQLMADSGGIEASPEELLHMLREAGFEAACLYLHGNRALFAARKVRAA